MEKDIIKKLQLNMAEENCDLFLTVDSIPYLYEIISNYTVKNRMNIIVLPKHFPIVFADEYVSDERSLRIINSDNLADMFDDDISQAYEVIIPFAECSVISEYGYKVDYGWIGELRSSKQNKIHVTALFSKGFEKIESARKVFCSENAIFVDTAFLPLVSAERFADKKKIYKLLNKECIKSAGRKNIIIFTTRRELNAFLKYLDKNVFFYVLTGKNDTSEYVKAITEFDNGSTELLLLTKSALGISLLTKADNLMYCGLPYSVSHAVRCAMLCKNYSIDIFYSDEDKNINTNIIKSNSLFFDEDIRENYVKDREKDLDNILKYLSSV